MPAWLSVALLLIVQTPVTAVWMRENGFYERPPTIEQAYYRARALDLLLVMQYDGVLAWAKACFTQAEFRTILQEREREVQHAHDNEVALAAREAELAVLQQHLGEASAALAGTRAELEQLRRDYADLCGQLEASRQAAAAAAAVPVAAPAAPAPAPATAGPSTDLLLSLVSEMATLKANLLNQQAQERAPVAAAGGTDVSAAIEKLAGSLNDRLEKLGRKMGVSGAVESDAPVDFGGMFKDTGKELESNMQNIEVKQKAGGGIAANLARLKKLKGGGS